MKSPKKAITQSAVDLYAREALYKKANTLALITIFYNIVEGVICVYLGLDDETITLLGFGADSFVEVISGIGIWHMIRRIKRDHDTHPDKFEQQALKVTGTAFYLLTLALLTTAVINIYNGHSPDNTFWGVAVSTVSIIIMALLIHYKRETGKQLNSRAILADADCTKTCVYLSVVLLLASGGYELTGIGALDSIGAILIALLSFREGRESFQKAHGMNCAC